MKKRKKKLDDFKVFIIIVLFFMLYKTAYYLDVYSDSNEWMLFRVYSALGVILLFIVYIMITKYDILRYFYRAEIRLQIILKNFKNLNLSCKNE